MFSIVFLTYLTFATNWIRGVDSHTTLGLHGLSGADPTGDPVLPEIEGPFEVEIKVRFNDDTPSVFQTIFEWSDVSQDNMVWFGQLTGATNHVGTVILVNGIQMSCSASNPQPVNAGDLITYKFGVDASGGTRVFQDGSLVEECLNRPIPLNVPRIHRLGNGLFDFNGASQVERLTGAILGLRLTNLNSVPPQDPGSRFAFMNFPTQTFASSFVASFYARWDNVNDATAQFQRAFDFGNGPADNNILCGQFQASSRMMLEVYDGGTMYRLVTPQNQNAIEEGEFAFWHCGATYDNTTGEWRLYIEKDGELLTQRFETLTLQNVFRKGSLVGRSHFPDADLDGVVLGLRLDRGGEIS